MPFNQTSVSPLFLNGRAMGPQEPIFVIAEAGINHEGDFAKAIELVDAAAEAGADCIKFQCHITEAEMIPTDMRPGKISTEKLWDIIKRCELTEDEEHQLMDYCRKKTIQYLCTPFSREAADRLYSLNVDAFKIGSGECNNLPLLKHISAWKKPIILSTGMNDIASIRQSVNAIQSLGAPLMLMHCTSMYPTPYEKVRLGVIGELMQEFSLPVGLSDHSYGIYTCLGAVALGACAVEKHFTISRSWPGPDNPISIEPQELKDLVKGVKAVFQARGGQKTILTEEQPVIDFAYASIVSIGAIRRGDKYSLRNIWVKRPGTGKLLAKDLERVLGKTAAEDLPANIQLEPKHISEFEEKISV